MIEEYNYRVLPQAIDQKKVSEDARARLSRRYYSTKSEGSGCLGCLGFIAWVVIVIVSYSLSEHWGLSFWPKSIIAVICASFVIALIAHKIEETRANKLAQQAREAERLAQKEATESELSFLTTEASMLTQNLRATYTSSKSLAAELYYHVDRISELMKTTRYEYSSNAFAPFWDAIEDAAKEIAAFNSKTDELSRKADEYYGKLNGREHSFPVFPIQKGTIIDATPLVDEFRKVVRMGQTNFQFANIWEHRRTREVLIAGFRTLGEAVNNVGSTIKDSTSNLEKSISSDVARLVEEQIKTRESLERQVKDNSSK
jgi:hypothetical protein